MKKLSDDAELLTTQLNSANFMNKDMLNEVEQGVRGEIAKHIDVATGEIGELSEQMQAQAKTADTTIKTLTTLLEQITALNKTSSVIQVDINE